MSEQPGGMSLTTYFAEISDGRAVWVNYAALPTETAEQWPDIAAHVRESAVMGLRHVVPRELFNRVEPTVTERVEWIEFGV